MPADDPEGASDDDGDPRPRVLALLRRHGYNATSFQSLEPGFQYWFAGGGSGAADACVAYVDTGRAWVAAGAPLSAETHLRDAAAGFVAAARKAGRRVAFFAAEGRLTEATGWPSVVIGEQPVWNPQLWNDGVRANRSLRAQVGRAHNKGVRARAVPAAEIARPAAPVRIAAERLIRRWLLSRKMAPLGFLVDVQPFKFPEERRYFVAEQDDRVVGFLVAVPVYTRGGWFFEDLLRDQQAPNGSAELLIDAAMQRAAADGATYVTLGLAPLAGRIPGWLAGVRRLSAPLYNFAGLHAFKAKLRPHRWDPVHLVWSPGGHLARALADALTAFARGSIITFGLQTLLRGPILVLWVLALALVPWTALLAIADQRQWFPAPWVRGAWIGFDAALFVALVVLARRFRRGLGRALTGAVIVDAVLTWLEAAVWNGPRIHGATDAFVVALACLAPTLAAVVLWGATRRAGLLDRL
ncbi:MAG TPA: phosphatidylglycerol lysyltransferase domain-containing protein [Polyangia bacterium]|nr:phosphatidylglycerol lysyltransferase domain-containing protein [Polyangia bacterium]